jgi:uncharacterized membrane-anchored protein YjiN (DUF445 family)
MTLPEGQTSDAAPVEAPPPTAPARVPAPAPVAPAAPVPASGAAWLADEEMRRRRLVRMQRFAAALLVLMSVIFVVTRLLEPRWPWLGYVRAMAEAAMVGGIADWFAVTALFRHPLGVPIPHTAIIPAKKDRIGRTLGGFVQANFLSPEVLTARLATLRVTERLAQWITEPEHARLIADHAAKAVAGAARVLRDEDVQELIDRSLGARIRRTRVAPLLGNALALVTAGDRHQRLLDEALRLVAGAVDENEDLIRDRIRAETPWWVPELVDERIHNKVVAGIDRTLQEISVDPQHPLRLRFDRAVHDFIESLRTSDEVIARAETIKEELLDHPVVRQFSASLWEDVKEALLRRASNSDAAPGALEQGLQTAGHTILADPALIEKGDRAITAAVLYVVEEYRQGVAQFIASTVQSWDADATSRKIELAIGRDLQFIRINGTIVGGLVGLILYKNGKLM